MKKTFEIKERERKGKKLKIDFHKFDTQSRNIKESVLKEHLKWYILVIILLLFSTFFSFSFSFCFLLLWYPPKLATRFSRLFGFCLCGNLLIKLLTALAAHWQCELNISSFGHGPVSVQVRPGRQQTKNNKKTKTKKKSMSPVKQFFFSFHFWSCQKFSFLYLCPNFLVCFAVDTDGSHCGDLWPVYS